MENRACGPTLSDEELFQQWLSLDLPEMAQVKQRVEVADWTAARHALAEAIRQMSVPDGFFDIVYEPPENVVMTPTETEQEACERIKKHTLISVGVPCVYGEGNPVDWEANPTYNGYKEWTFQLSRHHELKMLAHQYHLTGDDSLAVCAAELLHSWIRQELVPGPDVIGWHTNCWRTIECGIRTGTTWPYAFYAFHKHPAFTDEVLVDWIKSFIEHGRRLEHNHMSGNWFIMEMNGLAHISMMLPFLKQAEHWRQMSFRALTDELKRQIYPDGFQYELTTNYHNVIVINFQRLLNFCRVVGQPVPQEMQDMLMPVIGFEHKLMMPDGTTPDVNDGHRFVVKQLMEIRKEISPDHPVVKWLADGDTTCEPKETSMALPWSGFAVMRTGWSADAAWAMLDGGPYGRAHQHEDKLNVLFYADGKYLLTEGGNYAYDASAMRAYVLDTASHNTVMVDGLSQNRKATYAWQESDIAKKADELQWHFGKEWDWAGSTYAQGYGPDAAVKATHHRDVYLRRKGDPLLIVVDRLSSENEHAYETLWHVDSKVQTIEEHRVAFEEADLVFSSGKAQVVCGQEDPWQGFIATGTEQGMYRAVPCVMTNAKAANIRQVTVIAPARGVPLQEVLADTEESATTMTLVWADGREEVLDETVLKAL